MDLLRWTLIFLVIALIAGVFGFTGIYAGAASIAKMLLVVFLVMGRHRRAAPGPRAGPVTQQHRRDAEQQDRVEQVQRRHRHRQDGEQAVRGVAGLGRTERHRRQALGEGAAGEVRCRAFRQRARPPALLHPDMQPGQADRRQQRQDHQRRQDDAHRTPDAPQQRDQQPQDHQRPVRPALPQAQRAGCHAGHVLRPPDQAERPDPRQRPEHPAGDPRRRRAAPLRDHAASRT